MPCKKLTDLLYGVFANFTMEKKKGEILINFDQMKTFQFIINFSRPFLYENSTQLLLETFNQTLLN